MILLKRTNVFLFALLIPAILDFTGCASTGIQRSEKATTTMQAVDNDIKLISVQLDATASSLDDLTRPDLSDVRKAFDLYTDNVSKMQKMEKNFAKHADEMQTRGKEYFAEWEKEGNMYKNPRIQQQSEQRRGELSEVYDVIAEKSVGVKETFKTYISDITEIQTYLSNDLTSKGITAIAPLTQKVMSNGENLKYSIKNVQTAIDRARGEMSQGIK